MMVVGTKSVKSKNNASLNIIYDLDNQTIIHTPVAAVSNEWCLGKKC
jgi:hypothetical protein